MAFSLLIFSWLNVKMTAIVFGPGAQIPPAGYFPAFLATVIR